jgi:hypothetical protein
LKHLEDAARRRPPQRRRHLTEEECLELFEQLGREGCFDAEPDFPKALEYYREAQEQAKAWADPPWDPPADFMPNLADLPDLRLLNWRHEGRFPEVCAGWDWLAEMMHRVEAGIPAVTEAEFADLEEWFSANEDRVQGLFPPAGWLDMGRGRTLTPAGIRFALRDGSRAHGAGQLAADLRRLRALATQDG